jgi:Domain of unknown function (DUF5916)
MQIEPSMGSTSTRLNDYVLQVHHVVEKPSIDGRLSEATWRKATPVGGFVQHYPTDSLPARSQTLVYAAYDTDHMYFAIRCLDPNKGKYFYQSLRRDFAADESDGVMLTIDPLGTGQTGFGFRVSPMGVQSEGFIANGGNFGMDRSWDNVWYSEVHNDSTEWTAEIAIPLRAIRFESGRRDWRMNIVRWDWTQNELSTWTRFPLNFNPFSLAHTGTLRWDTPPDAGGVNMSIIPAVVGTLNHRYNDDNQTRLGGNVSLDAKWAVTPSLNLDVTINPDFSNVNVDRQVTNLERFSLFFPEQRQFFIENSDLFSQFGFSRIRPFFSRKIGLSNGSPVAIPAGVRLSGNLDDNWRVGLMSIQTAASAANQLETQNYTVAAVQRRLFGRSNLGLIVVNRQGNNFGEMPGNNFNRVVGLDYNLISEDGTWLGKLFYHQNFAPENKAGQFATAGWLRYSVPGLELNWNHEYIGENYNPEVGFVPRRGVWRVQPVINKAFFPEDRTVLNEHGFGVEFDAYFDNSGRFAPLDRATFPYYYFSFTNTMQLSVYGGEVFTKLTFPFDASGLNDDTRALPMAEYHYYRFGAEISSDVRAALSASASVQSGGYYNGTNVQYGGSLRYRVLPFGSLNVNVQHNNISLPQPYNSSSLTLVSAQLEFTPTREVFFTTFVQYNTQINNVNLNARLQWRFAPMSDVFLVYTDNYDATFWKIKNRGIALKISYWLNV